MWVRIKVAGIELASGVRMERGLIGRLVMDAFYDVDLASGRPV